MKRVRGGEGGFAISVEILLIAVILVVGLVTGWTKLRDQSLSEIKDSMAAIDAYILGSGPLWQTGGTRWICPIGSSTCTPNSVIEPTSTGAVTETWGASGEAFPTAEKKSDTPDGPIYGTTDGVLVYRGTPTPSSSGSGAGEVGLNPGGS